MKKFILAAVFLGVSCLGSISFADAYVRRQVQCQSDHERFNSCATGLTRIDRIYLSRQDSSAACIYGQSYGVTQDRITVSRGCRGWFSVEGRTYHIEPGDIVLRQDHPPRRPPRHGDGRMMDEQVRCESIDHRTRTCYSHYLYNVYEVYLLRQLSDVPCIADRTYYATRDGVTVSAGCRGDFILRGTR